MTHTYQLLGMTCSSCEAKVKSNLLIVPDISAVEVSKEKKTVTITMEKHISLNTLQAALGGSESKYKISAIEHTERLEEVKSWVETYKPLILIFFYIISITLLIQLGNNHFDPMQWMRHFMAGFFLAFSFFKILNLKGFAESYAMYDIIAKRFSIWGFVYAFIELLLGFSYLINSEPYFTNVITLIVMIVSIIGVLQSVFNKRQIKCACLGVVFNLPMSTITIIEDLVMIIMASAMLLII
jgi:copper chaperone CopZ